MSESDLELGAMCGRLLKLAAKTQQKVEATGLELVTSVRRNRNHEVMRWVRSWLGGPAYWRGEGCDKLVEVLSGRELDHLWSTDELTKHFLANKVAFKMSGAQHRFRVEGDSMTLGDNDGSTRQLDADKARSVNISEYVMTLTLQNGQTHDIKGEPEQLHQWQQALPSAEAVLLEKVFENNSPRNEPMRASRSQTLSTEHDDDSRNLAARVKEARKALDQSRAELDATLDARHMRRPLSPLSPDVSVVPTKSTLETRAILASISRIERKLDDPPRVSAHDASSKLVTIVATAAARAAVSVWHDHLQQYRPMVQAQQQTGQQPSSRHIPSDQATVEQHQPIRSTQQSVEHAVLRPQPGVQQPMQSAQQSKEHATLWPQQAVQQLPRSAQQHMEHAVMRHQQAVQQAPRSSLQPAKKQALVEPQPADMVPPQTRFSRQRAMRPSERPGQHSAQQNQLAHDMAQPEQQPPATHFPGRNSTCEPVQKLPPPAPQAVPVSRRARVDATSQRASSSSEKTKKKANKIRKKSPVAWKVHTHRPAAAIPVRVDLQQKKSSAHLIDLSGRCLRDGDLQVVCARLSEVQCINLSKNALTEVGVEVLCQRTLSKTGSDVDLSRNAIGPTGAVTLARAVAVGRLRRLDCSENPIGDKGAAALIGTVATDPPLVSLSLDCSETSLKLLVEALQANSTLERLSLCGLDFHKRRPELTRAAKVHPKLHTLLIDGVPFDQARVSTGESGAITNRLERLCRTFDRIEEEVASLRAPLHKLPRQPLKLDMP